jgi:hypothetical protein
MSYGRNQLVVPNDVPTSVLHQQYFFKPTMQRPTQTGYTSCQTVEQEMGNAAYISGAAGLIIANPDRCVNYLTVIY